VRLPEEIKLLLDVRPEASRKSESTFRHSVYSSLSRAIFAALFRAKLTVGLWIECVSRGVLSRGKARARDQHVILARLGGSR